MGRPVARTSRTARSRSSSEYLRGAGTAAVLLAARQHSQASRTPPNSEQLKTGSKHHVICDGNGTPLKVITTAGNVNDVTQTLVLVDGVPPVAGRVGHPRKRPDALLGDKGYDDDLNPHELRKRRILPVVSRKGSPNIESLGKLHYVVERTFALLQQFKRLTIRRERRPTYTTPSSHSPAASSAGGAPIPAVAVAIRVPAWESGDCEHCGMGVAGCPCAAPPRFPSWRGSAPAPQARRVPTSGAANFSNTRGSVRLPGRCSCPVKWVGPDCVGSGCCAPWKVGRPRMGQMRARRVCGRCAMR
ncbi:transposase [Streptomyces sp. 3MP-14]|uniref:Transposase n=1 Tax=Streptomyces mimosae TaxID=2586635 RepID=A0A5N6ADM0_9ACTN|nr:transposase [Streptomyces mimosae]KAB8176279.1 transposase [Streptomyces sp. 3MP-14]